MVELVRSGRTPEELAREFEPTAQSITNGVQQVDRDAGKRTDGRTSAEREELIRLRRENQRLRQERDILQRRRAPIEACFNGTRAWFARESKANPNGFSGSSARYLPTFPIWTMARAINVSASGYYAWRSRPASARVITDLDLTRKIRAIYGSSRKTYGPPRIHAEFKAKGVAIGKKRVARLMKAAGIAGASRRRSIIAIRAQSRSSSCP